MIRTSVHRQKFTAPIFIAHRFTTQKFTTQKFTTHSEAVS
jgi:hypothetical protein